ncbi:unnamed protein product [Anisakis simplex]|uniref:Pentatricopeptide repeat-containing protein n=1 Tax=Anisakis simplex TaxID=6269 RepID=A0A0M3J7H9_ANISI|nr:unnamed protein product [Anisakis simplex]
MTSLQRQLESLRTPATSRLGTERFIGSLLFDRKQAASLYKEEAHKIGISFVVVSVCSSQLRDAYTVI